ncbi:uncharacterized protein LOC121915604 [Sceloporus undulatus]|uniref:uncharacterized protein LOC121915604 n=1 Tax=Sceloporus undulatus TaxID=8520 RepID=UPI001C4D8FE6|nr:uncharacterized protein LOC121915604 [Sceloporus undulatus]
MQPKRGQRALVLPLGCSLPLPPTRAPHGKCQILCCWQRPGNHVAIPAKEAGQLSALGLSWSTTFPLALPLGPGGFPSAGRSEARRPATDQAALTSQPSGTLWADLWLQDSEQRAPWGLFSCAMRAWLWSRLRLRSSYKKHSRLEGNGEPGEAEEEEEEEEGQRGAEAAVPEGRPSQPPSASPLDREAAQEGKALVAPLLSKGHPPADRQPPGPALTPPDTHQEMLTLVRELEAVREFQSFHCQERKKDLRSCQECLKSLKAMQDNLQAVQSRLWRVEAKLGMRVSPPEEPEEEPEGDGGPFRLGTRSIAPPLG